MLPTHIQDKLKPAINECWNWTGYKNEKGYGRSSYKGKDWLTHRLVYTLMVGDIEGYDLDHKCYNHACANPFHLKPSTLKENGQNRKGANSNNSTGIRGVTVYKDGRYRARTSGAFLGYFNTIEEAEEAIKRKRG